MSEKLEKLKHEQYVAEKKLTAAKHKEKRLQSEYFSCSNFSNSSLLMA